MKRLSWSNSKVKVISYQHAQGAFMFTPHTTEGLLCSLYISKQIWCIGKIYKEAIIVMTEQVIFHSKCVWLLIAPLEVNYFERRGSGLFSIHPRMLLRAHSPTSGTRLCHYHKYIYMMGVLQQSYPGITLIIDFILFFGKNSSLVC